MKSNKTWSIMVVMLVAILLISMGSLTFIIDPYFHYHTPLKSLEYPIYNERYQNNGILKNFDYDAIIIGSSMTQNFKTSECDELFGVTSVKVPFSGASYKEINTQIQFAINNNNNIRYIIRGLDYDNLPLDKDTMYYNSLPEYLYDDDLFNDVSYLFNKDVLFDATCYVLDYTLSGQQTTTFDQYTNWMTYYDFGKAAVDKTYTRPEKSDTTYQMTDSDYEMVKENLQQNVISIAQANPEIDFYYFFTPYSIYYWDSLKLEGTLEKQLAIEKAAIELLIDQENIHLFSFYDDFSMICDLNNYKDRAHYSEDINSLILRYMANEEHRLTKSNYQKYCDEIYDFYTTYDYETLFQDNLTSNF